MRTFVRSGLALALALTVGGAMYFIAPSMHAQSSCVVQPSGAVAWYPGDGNANDIMRGNNGTSQGNVTFATGKVGQAFSFNGSSLVRVTASPSLNVGPGSGLTIDAWINPTSIADPQPLIGWNNGSSNGDGAHFWISASTQGVRPGTLFANIIDTNGAYHVIQSAGGLITPNVYQHVALTYDKASGVATLFLNGVVVVTQGLGSFTPQTSYDLYFANRPTTNYFYTGGLDEIGIFNRSLAQAEIQTIFNAGADGKCKATSLQFQYASYPSGQASDSVTVTVIRTGDTSGASSVSYMTADGTAKAGKDYTSTSGTLNFASGEQSKTILIPILNNAAATTDTGFQITLSNASGATLGATTSATLTIFKTVAGPGRILINDGNADSQFLQAFNVDGSNRFTLTPYLYRFVGTEYPSVSKKTGMIAFQGCGELLTSPTSPKLTCDHGIRVLVMNSDGTGFRQVTTDAGLNNPAYQNDTRPVISPDGTKIAFISARPPARDGREEAFVVNIDGTNLHPITTHVVDANAPNNESYAISVVWSPDSSKVLTQAFRPGKDNNGTQTIIGSLYTYNVDGTGETLLRRNVSLPVALDWSPDGRNILYANKGGPYGSAYGYLLLDALNPAQDSYLSGAQLGAACSGNGCILSSEPGSVRFSPDGKKIVYGAVPDQGNIYQDASVRTINLDGTNMSTVVTKFYPHYTEAKWWWPGAAIPKPDHLTLEPDPAVIYGSQKLQIVPTLYDAQNNVIFHNADFDAGWGGGVPKDAQHRFSGEFNAYTTANGFLYAASRQDSTGTVTVCASNGGVKACALAALNTESLSVTTTTPNIRKSGADGPGVLTIKRTNNAGATFPAIIVQFVSSGQAARDTDYYLTDSSGNRINGNAVPIPAGQTSFGIKIVPIASPSTGDKDVTLTLKSDESNYTYVADGTAKSATVTIKDNHPEQNALALTSITPNKGGDTGSITVTTYGANIKPGATVKLSRAGQPDIAGSSVNVQANGSYMTAIFDLIGKAQGTWSVVVTNPDGKSATLDGAFTVEPAQGGNVWVDVIGRYTMRGGLTQTFYIAYGNTADVDAQATVFHILIPQELTVVALPVLADGSIPVMHSNANSTTLEFSVPSVTANFSTYLPLQLKTKAIHVDVRIQAWALSSPGLALAQADQPDPTGTETVKVLDQTDNHQKSVIHVSSRAGTYDVTDETTITKVAQPSDPTFQRVVVGDKVEYRYTVTIPNTAAKVSGDRASTSAGGAHPLDGNGSTQSVKVVVVEAQYDEDFTKNFILNAHRNVHSYSVNRKALLACLRAKGIVDEPDPNFPGLDRLDAVAKGDTVLLRTLTRYDTGNPGGITRIKVENAHFFPERLFDDLLVESALNRGKLDTYEKQLYDDAHSSGVNATQFGGPAAFRERARVLLLLALLADCNCNKGQKNGSMGHVGSNIVGRVDTVEFKTESCPTCPMAQVCSSSSCPNCQEYKKDIDLNLVVSGDPNEKDGSQGGGAQHYVTGKEPLRYVVSFENVPNATAPAQTVVITDQLDTSKVDLSTVSLGAVGFSNYGTAPASGLSGYTTDIDLRPAKNLITRINGQLDKNTGLLTWRFTTIDPATGQPTTDPLAGFLPPNRQSPEGQGSVTFSVMPKAGLATGTEIRNKSRIIFDQNAPIDTNEYLNTIDNSNPTSRVNALQATQSSVIFPVSWTGTDTGSGIQIYSVYVSENGGAFVPWLLNTTVTSANFIGQPGKSYAFYGISRDAAGNQEPAKTTGEAFTTTRNDIINSIDDPRFFVRQHYLDFLSREPDQSGWDFWTNEIVSCGTNLQCIDVKRQNVSAAYFLSTEFQETGYLVYRIYKASYGNINGAPVPIRLSEFRPDTAEIGQGVIVNQGNWQQQLENNKQAFTLAFVQRPRFTAVFPTTKTPSQFVDALFGNAGVTPSATDRTKAINEFSGAADTSNLTARSKALRDVAENATLGQREFNRAFVLMQYFGYLRRNPNDAPDNNFDGYNFWLNKLNQFNGNFVQAEMVRAFLLSTEYRQRFGP